MQIQSDVLKKKQPIKLKSKTSELMARTIIWIYSPVIKGLKSLG